MQEHSYPPPTSPTWDLVFVIGLMIAVVLILKVSFKRLGLRAPPAKTMLMLLGSYLFIGYAFAKLYLLLWKLNPTAFDGLRSTEIPLRTFLDFLYFSFVTLATLGYGDIHPVSTLARAAAVIEVILGVFFVAVTVAVVVSKGGASDTE